MRPILRPLTLRILWAKQSGAEEFVENSLRDPGLAPDQAGIQVELRRTTIPAPGPGIVRGSVTENLYR